MIGGEGAEHVIAVGCGWGRDRSRRLVVADQSQLRCIDDKVGDMELLAIPYRLHINGVNGAGDTGSGVNEACCERVNVFSHQMSGEGRQRRVTGVDRSSVAIERNCAVRRKVSGYSERKGFLKGEILGFKIELIVGSARSGRSAGSWLDADGQLAIGYGDVSNRQVGNKGAGIFVCRGVLLSAADGGVVPGSVGGAEKSDLWRVEIKGGDVNLTAEDQRQHLDADFDLGGLKERLVAEGRIVGEGRVFGDEAAGEDREIEFPESDLAAERCGEG